MIVGTNVASLRAQNYLRLTDRDMQTSMERLSSGKRINSAQDDAAGLAISERMTNNIRGMDVATRNAQDGISLLQTSESALGSVSNILQRMRELAVQADNGTYSAEDVSSMQTEFEQLQDEITHIQTTSEFNGIKLFDGSTESVTLHISAGATDTIGISLINLDPSDINGAGIDISSLDLTTDPQAAISTLDKALDEVSTSRADLGASMNRLQFTIDNLSTMSNNLTEANSRIEDADMAKEVSQMTKQKILMQTTSSMLVQANQNPQMVLSLVQNL